MRTLRLAVFASFGVIAFLGTGDRAFGHADIGSDKGGDLARLAEQSNLVFLGRVARVDYRRSAQGSGEGEGLPHTIVTYEIDSVLRGQSPGKTFTMRFLGGADGSGRFMEVSGVPQFEPGEQDLLFVSGNGENNCPLVLCEWGRFRVLKGGVYNNHGFPVRAVSKTNVIARGMPPKEFLTFRYPAPKFEDLIKTEEVRKLMKQQTLSVAAMRKRYEAEAPKQIELSRDIPADPGKDAASAASTATTAIATTPEGLPEGPMAIEEFTTAVKGVLAKTTRKPVPVKSIDPKASIVVVSAKDRAPKKGEAPAVHPAPQTKEEKAELEALKKQDFNPVFKPQ
jgi:hypothetical protein